MSTTMTKLGIDRMTINDRLRLMEEIWDSIAIDSESVPVTVDQQDELDYRLADLDRHPGDESEWEEVHARLRGQQ